MEVLKKLFSKTRYPLGKEYIIYNILKVEKVEGERIIQELIDNKTIIEIEKDFYKLNV
jgi:hypothetical protein